MRYYFAGAYVRRAELEQCAQWLLNTLPGVKVTSRWLFEPQEGLDSGFSVGGMETAESIKKAWEYGQRDLEDIRSARAVVSFTGEGARGGRHVEHGMGILLSELRPITGYRLIVVGPREHVFHCHPATEQYATFDEFLKHELNREGER